MSDQGLFQKQADGCSVLGRVALVVPNMISVLPLRCLYIIPSAEHISDLE